MSPSTPSTPSTPVTIYYHADCLDGFGAAWAAWRRFGDAARYLPMHHGDAWRIDDVAGRDIFVVDFSFPPEVLREIAGHARSVCQIDHHASARDDWHAFLTTEPGSTRERFQDPECRLDLLFDLDKSGARLAWEHFQPDQPLPVAIAHIEDQDLWRFRLPGTRPFCRALRMHEFSFPAWDALIRAAETPEGEGYRTLLAEGEAVERFLDIEIGRLADSRLVMPVMLRLPRPATGATAGAAARDESVAGLAINASTLFTSELGGRLAERSGTFGLVWQLAADGEVKASLRGCNTVNVAHIARRYGGGGHPNAAGFRMPQQQFLAEVLASGEPPTQA